MSGDRLRVLQVEDSESDAALIERLLEKAGFAVTSKRVEEADELRAALESEPWDIVISDNRLPRLDGPAALRILRETGRDIPFIVVSGTLGEDAAVAMMRAGAQDYVTKDKLARLAPAVERELREAKSRHERSRFEEQFRQAQKLEGIGRLAGGVAHDFNNLITVILGYAQMGLDDLPREHALRESMEEIVKASMRAMGLTRQLLTFSREQKVETRDIAINDLVREFEKMLRRLIGEDVELVLRLESDAGILRGDPGQIEQVIMNLVVNARDAMPKGGKIFIETSSFFADEEYAQMNLGMTAGQYVMLAVSDTGIGMTKEIQGRIFEPFFTTKEVGKGTGLGLATVYGIVKQSRGTISVYSEPGHGSTFKILLPAAEGQEAPARPRANPAETSGHETILLVEDEAGVRRYVHRILERNGYQVLQASNGVEALQVARDHKGPIHLLVTDMVMPEMGGMELTGEFSRTRPNVPVICMSGYTDRMWHLGALSGYIQKPFAPGVLLGKVRELLNKAQSGAVRSGLTE